MSSGKGKLYCCCKEAKEGCDKRCPKGKAIKPDHIVSVPTWPKRIKP